MCSPEVLICLNQNRVQFTGTAQYAFIGSGLLHCNMCTQQIDVVLLVSSPEVLICLNRNRVQFTGTAQHAFIGSGLLHCNMCTQQIDVVLLVSSPEVLISMMYGQSYWQD